MDKLEQSAKRAFKGKMINHTFDLRLKEGGCVLPNIFIHNSEENDNCGLLYRPHQAPFMQFTGLHVSMVKNCSRVMLLDGV